MSTNTLTAPTSAAGDEFTEGQPVLIAMLDRMVPGVVSGPCTDPRFAGQWVVEPDGFDTQVVPASDVVPA